MYSLALIYIQGGVKCLWECELMSFVLYTINVACMCDARYVTWKYIQNIRYHVIFVKKYKTLQNVNIMGTRILSSGTSLFDFLILVFKVMVTKEVMRLCIILFLIFPTHSKYWNPKSKVFVEQSSMIVQYLINNFKENCEKWIMTTVRPSFCKKSILAYIFLFLICFRHKSILTNSVNIFLFTLGLGR